MFCFDSLVLFLLVRLAYDPPEPGLTEPPAANPLAWFRWFQQTLCLPVAQPFLSCRWRNREPLLQVAGLELGSFAFAEPSELSEMKPSGSSSLFCAGST